jgi:hypothetical protein
MTKGKKFFAGMAVLLSASLFFIGCETEVEVPGAARDVILHVDEFVQDLGRLQGALNDDGNTTVALVSTSGTLSSVKLEVPATKTLVLYASLTPVAAGMEINGTVYVELDGSLDASGTGKVSVKDGILYVSKGGTLEADADTDVNNGAGGTVLDNKSKVSIAGTLAWGGTVGTLAGLDPLLLFVEDGGMLTVTTAIADATPNLAAAKAVANPGKKLGIVADLADNASDTLVIPENAYISTSATLTAMESIEVSGEFVATGATLGATAGVALTVKTGGKATVTSATLLESEVEADATLTISTGKTLTLDSGATLALGAGALFNGAGKLVAGATEITGGSDNGWRAIGVGTITIGEDTITGSNGATALTAIAAGTNGKITVTATSAAKTLTVDAANIDIATGGNVLLTGGTAAATLVLKGGSSAAALVIDPTKTTQVTTVGTGGLAIGGTTGLVNPAAIKMVSANVVTTNVGSVVVQAATDTVSSAQAVGKLGGGTAAGANDLHIVSGASATTTIATGDGIVGS